MKTTTRYFTLLEICIVIAIISITASLFGHHFYNVIKKERVRKSAVLFKNTFQYCQELALLFQADVMLHIFQEKDGIAATIISDEIPNNFLNLKHGLNFSRLNLFLDEKPFNKTVYHFYSNGEIPSRYRLKYLNEDDKMENLFNR